MGYLDRLRVKKERGEVAQRNKRNQTLSDIHSYNSIWMHALDRVSMYM